MPYSSDIMSVRKFREKLTHELKINANNQGFYCCYSRCANKQLILDLYSSKNNEIIFGRRGTGKTTILKGLSYFVNEIQHDDDLFCHAIYIDMEDIVPNKIELENSDDDYVREIYRSILTKILERINKFCEKISAVGTYYNVVYYTDDEILKILELIDELEKAITEGTRLVKNVTEVDQISEEILKSRTRDLQLSGTIQRKSFLSSLSAAIAKKFSKTDSNSFLTEKQIKYRININEIRNLLDKLLEACKIEILYLCLDEFTIVDKNASVPLQISVAQLIKDTFFRNRHIIVKISSLWNREKMQARYFGIDRRGIELGEDVKWSVDLDEIFFDSRTNMSDFFAEVLGNIMLYDSGFSYYDDTKTSEKNIAFQKECSINAGTAMIAKLFKTRNSYNQLICGSQGIPRVFCNLISSCIARTNRRGETIIAFSDVVDAIIENYTQGVRKKIPDGLELLNTIENYVMDQKTRFFLVSMQDYKKIQNQIEGLVDANALHQFPSANVDRRLRNRYKLFLVHYGNFMEALAGKNSSNFLENDKRCDALLYPKLPPNMIAKPTQYQLAIPARVYEQLFCPECKAYYYIEDILENTCPHCGSKLG